MKPNESVYRLIDIFKEICEDGNIQEMYFDRYMAKLIHFLGTDERKIKSATTYYRGMGMVREELRGKTPFAVFLYDKIPKLDT